MQDQLVGVTGLRLDAPAEVILRPGSQGTFAPILSPARPHRLEAFGGLADWATAGEGGITITVPLDADVGDFGEIVVRATAMDNPLDWAIARVRVTVGETDSLPAPAAKAKESPAPTFALVGLALLALALARRRK